MNQLAKHRQKSSTCYLMNTPKLQLVRSWFCKTTRLLRWRSEDSWIGVRGEGAFYVDHRESGPEHIPIAMKPHEGEQARVVTSRSHAGAETEELMEQLAGKGFKIDRVSFGSSLKLCMVASGQADLYPRMGPTMEWDTGAAHAVVSAAGGHVVDFANRPLAYNKTDQHNPFFVVCGPEGLEHWIQPSAD